MQRVLHLIEKGANVNERIGKEMDSIVSLSLRKLPSKDFRKVLSVLLTIRRISKM